MTEKQKRFADEYLIDLNATRAYRTIYKNIKNEQTAAVCASKLLRKTKVKDYISQQLEKIHNERTADVREVMEYLTSVMRGKSEAEIVVVEGQGDGVSSASKILKAPDERERLKAAELLGKRYGMFTDKINVDGFAQVLIVDDLKE